MARDYALVRSLEELQALVRKLLADGQPIGFDIETGYSGPSVEKRALDVMHPDQFIVGFSITNSPSWARYVPLRHEVGVNLSPVDAWECVRPVLETLPAVCHHKKFEEKNLLQLAAKGDARAPIRMPEGFCTMLEAYTLSEWQGKLGGGESISSATGLKVLTEAVLGVKQSSIDSLFGDNVTAKGLKQIRFNTLNSEDPKVVEYACDDAALALELHHALGPRASVWKAGFTPAGFILNLELKISQIMAEVENYGVGVDWAAMRQAEEIYRPFRETMERNVKRALGEMTGTDLTALNLASPKQLGKVLYEDLSLPVLLKTDTGAASTKDEAIAPLAKEHPAVGKILELRQLDNLGKRHIKWLTEYGGAVDRRVHPNFAQGIVASGRFAAGDPAIQQLPKKWYWAAAITSESEDEVRARGRNGVDYWAGNFRDYIVADPGNVLLTFDYSQVELRVLAGVSKEQRLLEAFENDEDVHVLTAAMMLGKPMEEVTESDRQAGKTLNFSLLYQMGVTSLARRLMISREEAEDLFARYFQQFTQVESWVSTTRAVGRAQGFVTTPFGRKVTVWELQSPNPAIRSKGDRLLVNAPIQGGAADYMKIGMIRAAGALKKAGLWGNGVMMTMNQHDSLTFEVSLEHDLNEVREMLQQAVVFPVKGFPTMRADWEFGPRWGSSTKWPLDVPVERASSGEWLLPGAEPVPVADADDDFEEMITEDSGLPLVLDDVPRRDGPRELCVEIPTMPTRDELEALLSLVDSRPGDHLLQLRTPEGVVRTRLTTSLTLGDEPAVSAALGGAVLRWDEASVDLSALSDMVEI